MIGINDAERIAPVDITIFRESWVEQALAHSGHRSRLYVSPFDYRPVRGKAVKAPYTPLGADMADLMMQRLLNEELVIEDVLFLTALKIAQMVARLKGRPQTVYMVGFDFDPGQGYAAAVATDYATDYGDDQRAAQITPQEFYFVNALYMLRHAEIDVQHVGERPFSALSPEEFNALFEPAHAERPEEATGPRVAVVAELTTNHFGDRHRLERMIRAARAAGADFVKLQKRDVETFYSPEQLAGRFVSPFGPTFRDYRHGLELDRDDFAFVDALCRDLGIGWFASVLDEPSFRFMLDFKPGLVKLPSTISEHTDYLAFVARTYRGSIVLSTGMTDGAYERWVLDTFTECEKLYLLQCNSAYPTPLHDCSVGVIRRYRDLAREHRHVVPGYSSHDFGWLASALAVAAGAEMVEKHVKLGNTEWAHFDAVAMDLTTPVFKEYVQKIREAEMILGTEEKKINKSEHHKYRRSGT